MLRLSVPLAVALLLGACAPTPSRAPADDWQLRLPPASFGRAIAWQQQLVFAFDGREERVDAALEVDADAVRLALHRAGVVVLRLRWDGTTLDARRAPQWPAQVDAGHVLADLQLAHWPPDAVRAALPIGWRLDVDADGTRRLHDGRELVVTVAPSADAQLRLTQHRRGYRIDIRSEAGAR